MDLNVEHNTWKYLSKVYKVGVGRLDGNETKTKGQSLTKFYQIHWKTTAHYTFLEFSLILFSNVSFILSHSFIISLLVAECIRPVQKHNA